MARLDLFQRVVVVNELRPVVKIDQYLDVAVWKKSVDGMRVLYAAEINKQLDELTEREGRKIGCVQHRGQAKTGEYIPSLITFFDEGDLLYS